MLHNIHLEKILFLDIETVPMVPEYELLPEPFRRLWDKKAKILARKEEDTPEDLFGRAGIYAEFGKIVCISVGYMYNQDFRIKSFFGDDEMEFLKNFPNC